MEAIEKYLKIIEKELKGLDKKTKDSIIKELRDHIYERLSIEERKSMDKITEVIGKPKEVAKGYLNISEEIYKPPNKLSIWLSILIGIILFLFSLFYLIKLSDALSKPEVEYKLLLLISSFLFISISVSLIYMSYKQSNEFKSVKNFKKLSTAYLIIGILLISIAFTAIKTDNSLTKSKSIPDAEDISIGIDKNDNVHILWSENENWKYWSLHYTKLNKNENEIIDNMEIVKMGGDYGYSGYYMSKIDILGNVHIIWSVSDSQYYNNYGLNYIKIDSLGNFEIEKKIADCYPLYFGYIDCFLTTDSNGNAHFVYTARTMYGIIEDYIVYLKIEENREISYHKITEKYSGHPKIGIDSKFNVYIFWSDSRDWHSKPEPKEYFYKYEIYMSKIDNNSNIIINQTRLTKDPFGNFLLEMFVNDEDEIFIFWEYNNDIYWLKISTDGKSIESGNYNAPFEIDWDLNIQNDNNDNLYIYWNTEGYYCYLFLPLEKLKNESIEFKKELPLEKLTSIKSKNQKFAFDSNNNIHVSWIEKTKHEKYKTNDAFFKTENKTIQLTQYIKLNDNIFEVISVGISLIVVPISLVILAKREVKIFQYRKN